VLFNNHKIPCFFFLQGNADEFEIRMLLHQSLAGCVIGKGGAKIKELKDVSH
jgi:predicted RNA-binding protein YlqC (UPF0109 family)